MQQEQAREVLTTAESDGRWWSAMCTMLSQQEIELLRGIALNFAANRMEAEVDAEALEEPRVHLHLVSIAEFRR